jgi:hypothetical protein
VRNARIHLRLLAGLVVPLVASLCATRPAHAQTRVTRTERVEKDDGPHPVSQFVWLDAEAGVQQVNLRTFTVNADPISAGLIPTLAVGPEIGAAAGVRLLFLTLGARVRAAEFQSEQVGSWSFTTIDAEVGFRAPLGRFEPYISVAAGYATVGGLATAVPGLPNALSVRGFNARFGAGLDYWVTNNISIGARGSFDVLAMSRPGVPVDELASATQAGTLDQAKAAVLEANGSSAGTALGLTGGVGLHF